MNFIEMCGFPVESDFIICRFLRNPKISREICNQICIRFRLVIKYGLSKERPKKALRVVATHWWIQGPHPAHAPLRDPILSFRHTNFTKHSCLGSPRPPYEVHAPLREILDPPLLLGVL